MGVMISSHRRTQPVVAERPHSDSRNQLEVREHNLFLRPRPGLCTGRADPLRMKPRCALFLPPPLWGRRVGVGGRGAGHGSAASLDPTPDLPTRGGEQEPVSYKGARQRRASRRMGAGTALARVWRSPLPAAGLREMPCCARLLGTRRWKTLRRAQKRNEPSMGPARSRLCCSRRLRSPRGSCRRNRRNCAQTPR
jgi:hypothetical protein